MIAANRRCTCCESDTRQVRSRRVWDCAVWFCTDCGKAQTVIGLTNDSNASMERAHESPEAVYIGEGGEAMTVYVVLIEYGHGVYIAGVRTTQEAAEALVAERKAEHESEGDWSDCSVEVCEVKP